MQYQKYIDALAMMDDVIAESERASEEAMKKKNTDIWWVYLTEEEREVMHAKWDELYEYVYANFKEPESKTKKWFMHYSEFVDAGLNETVKAELASMREMFKLNREELEERLYEIPPTVLEQCFPVWMARYMLAYRGVPVYPIYLKTFDKFHALYGFMICNARFLEDAA